MSSFVNGPSPPTAKRRLPMADVHLISSIKISHDDKARLRSDYMKRYNESLQKPTIAYMNPPAGAKSIIRQLNDQRLHNVDTDTKDLHINKSRRKILNDFITRKTDGDSLANRNMHPNLRHKGSYGTDLNIYIDGQPENLPTVPSGPKRNFNEPQPRLRDESAESNAYSSMLKKHKAANLISKPISSTINYGAIDLYDNGPKHLASSESKQREFYG